MLVSQFSWPHIGIQCHLMPEGLLWCLQLAVPYWYGFPVGMWSYLSRWLCEDVPFTLEGHKWC